MPRLTLRRASGAVLAIAAVARLLAHGVEPDHATDHGGTVSVYLSDPDGNGVELYYDRPRSHWRDADGRPVLKADRFDFHDLLP